MDEVFQHDTLDPLLFIEYIIHPCSFTLYLTYIRWLSNRFGNMYWLDDIIYKTFEFFKILSSN